MNSHRNDGNRLRCDWWRWTWLSWEWVQVWGGSQWMRNVSQWAEMYGILGSSARCLRSLICVRSVRVFALQLVMGVLDVWCHKASRFQIFLSGTISVRLLLWYVLKMHFVLRPPWGKCSCFNVLFVSLCWIFCKSLARIICACRTLHEGQWRDSPRDGISINLFKNIWKMPFINAVTWIRLFYHEHVFSFWIKLFGILWRSECQGDATVLIS